MSGFAYGTLIATREGITQPCNLIKVGDKVLAAASDGESLRWQAVPVWFASSTGLNFQGVAAYITYLLPGGDTVNLISEVDQLFLLVDGTLVRADKLVPGRDCLVLADGQRSATVDFIALGEYMGSMHRIAASGHADSIDQHLINAGGVVCGDYVLCAQAQEADG